MIQVIVWDNEGERTVEVCANVHAALLLAKKSRTLSNRTVKIADVFGSTYHWSRSTHLDRNHWSVRAVASEAFD
jgi:hypothetical protein